MAITHAQLYAYAEEYLELKNEIAEKEARLTFLKEKLLLGVPANTELVAEGRRILHKEFPVNTLDQHALKEKEPDIFERYKIVRFQKRLTVR